MPWTVAHAAAVLPLRRKRLPFTALVVGAMAPDFGYYVARFDLAAQAHAANASALLSIPVGFGVLAAWRAIGRLGCEILPSPYRQDLQASFGEEFAASPPAISRTCLALAIGAATHVGWDGFTHAYGWFTYYHPAMRVPVKPWPGQVLPAYRALQHASTIAGMLLLLAAYRRAHRERRWFEWIPSAQERGRALLFAGVLAVAACTAALLVGVRHPGARLEEVVFRLALYGTAAFATFACLAGIALRERSG